MAILNYTTSVSTSKSAQELTAVLVKAGAEKILIDYAGGEAVAITFAVPVGPEKTLWYFTLPANWQGVQKSLVRAGVLSKYRTETHAKRVAWRIILNWCQAQLAIIEAGQANLAEIFLFCAQTDTGETLYKSLETGKLNLLR